MDSPRTTLDELLQQHRAGELAEFNATGNHVPMVLIALHRMGAANAVLRRYGGVHGRPSVTDSNATPQPAITRGNWRTYCGDFAAWSSYRRFFQSEVGRCGTDEVLHCYLPHLMSGVAGHAFHPILRVGYGLDIEDSQEIAFGLAYWAAAYLPAPEAPSSRSAIAPVDLLNAFAESERLRDVRSESQSIARRISALYAEDDFRRLLRPIQWVPERPLTDIAPAIAETFSHTQHFTILHGVTSCHALRLVLPYLEDVGKAISEYWYAMCAAYLSVVNVTSSGQDRTPERDDNWQDVFKEAIAIPIEDTVRFEHTIKLVYTCFKEWEWYGRDIYRALAIREVDAHSRFV